MGRWRAAGAAGRGAVAWCGVAQAEHSHVPLEPVQPVASSNARSSSRPTRSPSLTHRQPRPHARTDCLARSTGSPGPTHSCPARKPRRARVESESDHRPRESVSRTRRRGCRRPGAGVRAPVVASCACRTLPRALPPRPSESTPPSSASPTASSTSPSRARTELSRAATDWCALSCCTRTRTDPPELTTPPLSGPRSNSGSPDPLSSPLPFSLTVKVS